MDIVIPANATWLVLQIESESDQKGESGASIGGGPFVVTPAIEGESELPVDVELLKNVSNAAAGPYGKSLETSPGSTVWWQVVATAKATTSEGDPLGDITGLVVVDEFPAGLTVVSATGDGSYDPNTDTWTTGSLAAGASATLLVETRVEVTGPIVNLAEVTAHDQPDIDSTPGNGPQDPVEDDDDGAGITSSLIDVELTKLVDGVEGPVSRKLGDQIVYTIEVRADDVTDDGLVLSDVTGLAVTDVLPADVNFVSAIGDGSYDPATGLWEIGSLASGSTARIDLTVTINVSASVEFDNIAEVVAHDQPDIDSTPGNGPQNPAEDDDDGVTVKIPTVEGDTEIPGDVGGGDTIPATGAGSSALGLIGALILLLGLDLVLMSMALGRLDLTWNRS